MRGESAEVHIHLVPSETHWLKAAGGQWLARRLCLQCAFHRDAIPVVGSQLTHAEPSCGWGQGDGRHWREHQDI